MMEESGSCIKVESYNLVCIASTLIGNLPDLLGHSLIVIFTSQDGDNTEQLERGDF
jgi:hypothetical protein